MIGTIGYLAQNYGKVELSPRAFTDQLRSPTI